MGENRKELGHPKDFIRLRSDSGSEDVHYSVFCEYIPEEYKLYAEKTLKETDENKEKGLRKLEEFLRKENLACSENDLLAVLRSCKYNFKKSESKLKRFLKCRREVIEKLCKMDQEKMELIMDDIIFSTLPYRDKFGRTVFYTRPTINLDLYTLDDVEPIAWALVLYLLNFPLTTVSGISYIAECKCESIYIFYPIIKAFRNYIHYVLDLPIRAGRTDLLNENFLCRIFFNAIRPILPQKISKRVFFNGNSYQQLRKVYHPDLLPEEFEGKAGAMTDKFYRERLLNFIEKLKAEGLSANCATS